MKQIKHTCFIWLLLFCSHLPAQNIVNQVDSLAGNIVKTLRAENKEKIFLQTNRKVFAAGEKIWFKAYLVKALDNRLDTTSKNLFVDLVNDKDKPVAQLVLNAVTQQTSGVIALSDSLGTGNYWLRSYTQRMIKEDVNSVFLQPLYIINVKKPTDENKARMNMATGLLNIQFFPEGGSLITGMNSTGALQVTDATGKPVATSGYVVNNKDSIVASFTTNRFGLARVTFYPKWFEKYQAVVKNGTQDVKYPLKAWDPFAAQIAVIKQDHESLQAYVSLEDSIYTRKYTTYILGLSKDSVCYAGIGRGMCQLDIPVNDFPGGVATLLLFNEDKQLVSERKVFIDKDNFRLNLKTDKVSYTARDKANLAVEVTDANGKPLLAALNVAVEDDRVMNMSDLLETDFLQPAGLSVDEWLKLDKGKMTKEEIDLLMLAQPPVYKSIIAANTNKKDAYKDDNELLVYLKGNVSDKKDNPLKDRVVTEILKDDTNTFLDVDTTGIGGGFRLNLPGNRENMRMMVQVADRYGKLQTDDRINIDTFSFPRFVTPTALKNKFTLTSITPQAQVKKYHVDSVFIGVGKEWLAPVTVKSKAKKPDTYNTSKRVHPFSSIISSDMINKGGYGIVADMVLQVPGVSIKDGYVAFLGGSGFGSSAKSEPIVIMDGVQMVGALAGGGSSNSPGTPTAGLSAVAESPVMEFLNSLNPRTIDFIEVLTGADAGSFGLNGGNGVIVINTTAQLENYSAPSGIRVVSPKTYHISPLFNMPDYSIKQFKDSKTTDLRNTIYWNGNLMTDVNGKASINFYTADIATTYSVIVSGITANGEYIYKRIAISRK